MTTPSARPSNDPDYTKWMSRRTYCRRMVTKYQLRSDDPDPTKSDLAKAKVVHYTNLLADSETKLAEVRSRLPLKKRGLAQKSESPKNSDSEGEHSSSEEIELN